MTNPSNLRAFLALGRQKRAQVRNELEEHGT